MINVQTARKHQLNIYDLQIKIYFQKNVTRPARCSFADKR